MNLFNKKKESAVERKDLTKSYTFSTFLIGAALTYLFYNYLISTDIFNGAYYDKFVNRGPIPYLTTYLFFWGLALILFHWLWLARERTTFDLIRNTLQDFKKIDRESAQVAMDKIRAIEKGKYASISSNRFIRALRRVRDGVEQKSEISEMMGEQASIDYNIINTKNTPVKFFIWLIPILGFIGTVVGVSDAISAFSDIITAGSDLNIIKGNLGGVTTSLGVAFDTTLLALIKTAILMFGYSTLQKQQLSYLITMDEFSVDDLTKKVVPEVKRQDKSETAQLTTAIGVLTEQITTWDPRFADTLNTFFSRIEQQSNEVITSITTLNGKGEQIAEQNSQTAVTISKSMDRFKAYTSEIEQSVQALFAQIRETTGHNSQTAITISESMDRFKTYSSEVEHSVQGLFAQVQETTERSSQTAITISESMDRYRDYSSSVERSVQDALAQVKEATSQNSQTAITISESVGRFQSHSSDVLHSVQELFDSVKETTGQSSTAVNTLSQTIVKFASQINEFNSLQATIQENIKCITDLEEFNRCLNALSHTLDKLPSLLTNMMRPREIRLVENLMGEDR
ncbi:MAG: MotA/TolQ/ExbB proton channel family protein [Proteobacteria bacterium]|nr:MotA/TolQ/ExbB proton channel family protein [Pseudomonadota bacterium]MBU1688723.1 MotA/TolQ/ExbB proton channel family protein [Pseudomonadota bacterium]